MNGWLSNVLFWALWFPAMALTMWLLSKLRLEPAGKDVNGKLHHTYLLRWVGTSGIVLFGGLMLFPMFAGPEEFGGQRQQYAIAGLFGCFTLLFIPLLVEYVRVRHQLVDGGLRYQPLFRRGGILQWNNVRCVCYSETNKWFRLDGNDGQVVRISAMMVGLPEFARVLLQNVPAEAIDPAALPVLIASSDGNPPRLW